MSYFSVEKYTSVTVFNKAKKILTVNHILKDNMDFANTNVLFMSKFVQRKFGHSGTSFTNLMKYEDIKFYKYVQGKNTVIEMVKDCRLVPLSVPDHQDHLIVVYWEKLYQFDGENNESPSL